MRDPPCFFFFFFNDTATTEIYTLSLHDALPIFATGGLYHWLFREVSVEWAQINQMPWISRFDSAPMLKDSLEPSLLIARSEEHTSELQSLRHLVCRLLLEKKKKIHHRKRTWTRI